MRDLTQLKSGEEAENFFMYSFKITTCPTKYAHDWTSCPYAHSGESARRRQPQMYKPIPCPESKGGNPCPRGDSCKYAHNDFEYWLHPARYKTEYCKQGPGCNRKICFFAHRPEEIRTAPPVVFTKQGPFLDSATTARNRQRLEQALSATESVDGGCPMPASPWTMYPRRQSSAVGRTSSYGDARTIAAATANPNDIQQSGSPRERPQLNGLTSTAPMGSPLKKSNGFDENGYAASVADLQAALSVLTNTSTPRTPFGDISPFGSLTPSTSWSLAAAQSPFNPFGQMTPDSIGSSDQLLLYLQHLQALNPSQTSCSISSEHISPRQSLSAEAFHGIQGHRASASLSHGLMNLAHMMNPDAAAATGDPVLFSSLSDGVIHRGGPSSGSFVLNNTTSAAPDRA